MPKGCNVANKPATAKEILLYDNFTEQIDRIVDRERQKQFKYAKFYTIERNEYKNKILDVFRFHYTKEKREIFLNFHYIDCFNPIIAMRSRENFYNLRCIDAKKFKKLTSSDFIEFAYCVKRKNIRYNQNFDFDDILLLKYFN